MSRDLVTVKTKHGHIRVPADKAPKINEAEARHEALLHGDPVIVGEDGPEAAVILPAEDAHDDVPG